jgi:hypothetical protein
LPLRGHGGPLVFTRRYTESDQPVTGFLRPGSRHSHHSDARSFGASARSAPRRRPRRLPLPTRKPTRPRRNKRVTLQLSASFTLYTFLPCRQFHNTLSRFIRLFRSPLANGVETCSNRARRRYHQTETVFGYIVYRAGYENAKI